MKLFSTEELKRLVKMILLCITSYKGHELWKLSTAFVH